MFIRILFLVLISASIAITYYVMVIQRDFAVLTNPEGPDTSDYFEEAPAESMEETTS